MKYSKVAAVVAGTVIAVGTGSTAFADTGSHAAPVMPTNINGGVDQLMAAQPAQQVLQGTHLNNVVHRVDATTDAMRGQSSPGSLLGQATQAAHGVGQVTQAAHGSALSTVTGAVPGASLLGGLPLAGLPLGGLPLRGLPLGGLPLGG